MPRPTSFVALVAASAIALSLAGCGGQIEGVAGMQDPVPPGTRANNTDGFYKGRVTLAASLSSRCPGSSVGQIEIGDGKLYFAYQPGILFVAPIQPDGSLHAESDLSLLDGTLRDGLLLFTVRTLVCASSYDMRRMI